MPDSRHAATHHTAYQTNRFLRTPRAYPPDTGGDEDRGGPRLPALLGFALGLGAGLVAFLLIHSLFLH
jgi:hypothetical protein